ncbi:hypothetical protein [Rickettsia massiliae]|uniref:hypothetical protein n=1 Tax=Rickettsia massiliae TaxID=35791 RepID=UPI0002EC53A0|nr:hypothetical protein [Rickettsia massiliae]
MIENGAKTVCSVQGFVSDVNNSNYSVVSTFAQATVVSLVTFAYYNPPALIGAFTLGAILISPSDSIECVKKTVKAGVTAGYVAYETVEGLVAGTAGIVSLMPIIFTVIPQSLPAAINTNIIEYYS